MKSFILSRCVFSVVACLVSGSCFAFTGSDSEYATPSDTIAVTKGKTVHIVLGQTIRYASLSSNGEIESRIVSEQKGIISFRAREAFKGDRNLTLILSDEKISVFIIQYRDDVNVLLKDYSGIISDGDDSGMEPQSDNAENSVQVHIESKRIHHISDRYQNLVFSAEMIRCTDSGTEILLSLDNRSSGMFVPSSIRIFQKSRCIGSRVLTLDKEIRYSPLEGNLTTLSGQKAYMRIQIPQSIIPKNSVIEIYMHDYTLASSMCLRISPADFSKGKKYCSSKRY